MHDQVAGREYGGDFGVGTTEQLRALQEQRRLVDSLLEDIARTRSRLDIEPGVGAAWRSPAQKMYLMRRRDVRSRFGRIVWLLEEARESLSDTIVREMRG